MKIDRRYLFWSVAAVFTAAVICTRISFFHVLPLPFVQPDSPSYLRPAFSLISGGGLNLTFDRTPGYPLFIYTALAGAGTFFRLLIMQHVLLLLIGAMAAFLYYKAFSGTPLAAFLVAAYTVFHPRLLIYAHSVMTEIPYTGLVMASVVLLYIAESKKNWSLYATAGLVAGLALLVRPVGWSLVAAFVGWTILAGRTKDHYKGLAVMAGGWLSIVGSLMVFNYFTKGFFGICRIGSFALFGSYAFLLPLDKIPDPQMAQVLQPIYASHADDIRSLNWVVYDPAGPVAALTKITKNENELADVVGRLTRLAIISRPVDVVRRIVDRTIYFFAQASRRPKHLYPKEFPYLNGIMILCSRTEEFPFLSGWLPCDSTVLQNESIRIKSRPLYPFEKTSWTPSLLWGLMITSGLWVPVSALIAGLFLCFLKDGLKMALLLLMVIASTALITAISQDIDGRYTIPVEPFYGILVMAFVECLLRRINKSTR